MLQELMFQIDWRDDRGQVNAGNFSHPFITVEVSAPRLGKWQRTEVMIDTGLSRTSFAPEIMNLAGCSASGTVRLSGSQGWQDMPTHKLDLRFPAFPGGVIETEGAMMEHPLGETQAGGLLGMDVLRLGKLVLDPAGKSYFALTPPSQNRPAI